MEEEEKEEEGGMRTEGLPPSLIPALDLNGNDLRRAYCSIFTRRVG